MQYDLLGYVDFLYLPTILADRTCICVLYAEDIYES